jgi:hypothetical protein
MTVLQFHFLVGQFANVVEIFFIVLLQRTKKGAWDHHMGLSSLLRPISSVALKLSSKHNEKHFYGGSRNEMTHNFILHATGKWKVLLLKIWLPLQSLNLKVSADHFEILYFSNIFWIFIFFEENMTINAHLFLSFAT